MNYFVGTSLLLSDHLPTEKNSSAIVPLLVLPAKQLSEKTPSMQLYRLILNRFIRKFFVAKSSSFSESFQADALQIRKEITINNNGLLFKKNSREYKKLGWKSPTLCLVPDLINCSLSRAIPDKLLAGDKLTCLLPVKMKVGTKNEKKY